MPTPRKRLSVTALLTALVVFRENLGIDMSVEVLWVLAAIIGCYMLAQTATDIFMIRANGNRPPPPT